MSPQRPTAATASIWLTIAALVLSGISAVLTIAYRDELLAAWRAGRDDSSSIEQPSFVPVTLVMYVVVALLMWVLLMFFREGHTWARRSIIALFVLIGVGIVAVLRTDPPTLFFVLCGLTLVVTVAAIGCLLHKDTRAWCREEIRA